MQSVVFSGFVILILRIRWIPRALPGTAYSLVWREEGVFCVEQVSSFFPPSGTSLPNPLHLYFPLFISVTGACLFEGMGARLWLACQDLPAIVVVSILELAANSESCRMTQAPNLHLATQLLNIRNINFYIITMVIATMAVTDTVPFEAAIFITTTMIVI